MDFQGSVIARWGLPKHFNSYSHSTFFFCPNYTIFFAFLLHSGHFPSLRLLFKWINEKKVNTFQVCSSACESPAFIRSDLLHKPQTAKRGQSRKIRERSRSGNMNEKTIFVPFSLTRICMLSTLITCISVWGSVSGCTLSPTLSLSPPFLSPLAWLGTKSSSSIQSFAIFSFFPPSFISYSPYIKIFSFPPSN